MRKIIAALQTSVEGFIEGLKGEMDWIMAEDEDAWRELFAMLDSVDTCILGRVMYPGYEEYWLGVLASPSGFSSPLFGAVKPTKNDIAYARWADKTPHVLLSRTLDKVTWKTTRIVRDVEDIRKLKQQPGKNMYVVGGATLVSGLMNAGLVDELQLMVTPLVLGVGKALFKDVTERKALQLVEVKPLKSGKVRLIYTVPIEEGTKR